MLELGIVADEISRDFRTAVNLGLQAGLRRYEVRFLTTGRAPLCDEQELGEVERIREGEGITITALSPGLFKWTDTPEKFRIEMQEVFPRAVELAQRWNLSSLIVFGFCKPGATEENADMVAGEPVPIWVLDAMAEATELAARVQLQLFIEPEPVCFAESGAAAAKMIRAVNSPALGINYDPCNDAWMLRRDPIADFEIVAPFIRNVHIKDQLAAPRGSGMPTWVFPEEGMLDWPAHFAALQRSDYNGPISLEPHFPLTVEHLQRYKALIEQWWESAEKN